MKAVLGQHSFGMMAWMARATSLNAIAIAAVLASATLPATAADNPFPGLVGNWSGTGQAKLDGDKTETMRCKAYYTSQADSGLGLAIRCANASAKIDLRASLTYSGGSVGGSWEERTYNAVGTVAGKAAANKVNLSIVGGGLTASMVVAIASSSHTVTIVTDAPGLKGVNISLTRG
jgi:hypothetical protein